MPMERVDRPGESQEATRGKKTGLQSVAAHEESHL